jgi:hypothetical protein
MLPPEIARKTLSGRVCLLGEPAHRLAGLRVDNGSGDPPVGRDLEFAAGQVMNRQMMMQGVPGANRGRAVQRDHHFTPVEQGRGHAAVAADQDGRADKLQAFIPAAHASGPDRAS